MGSPENVICEILAGLKNIDNVLFRRAISVLCNVLIVDYCVKLQQKIKITNSTLLILSLP